MIENSRKMIKTIRWLWVVYVAISVIGALFVTPGESDWVVDIVPVFITAFVMLAFSIRSLHNYDEVIGEVLQQDAGIAQAQDTLDENLVYLMTIDRITALRKTAV